MERVTGIEPAWPAWKDPQGPPCSSIRVHFRRPSHSGVVHENPGLFRHLGHAKGTTAALFRGSGLVLVSVSAPEPSTLRYGFVGQAPTGARRVLMMLCAGSERSSSWSGVGLAGRGGTGQSSRSAHRRRLSR